MIAEPPLVRLLARVILLCATAGYVDAFGYVTLDRVFAANMTGNTVLLAIAAVKGDLAPAKAYILTLGLFFAAAVFAAILRRLFERAYISLVTAAVFLLLIPLAKLDREWTLALLAAAMGLQGACISRFGSVNLHTVVVTGTIVKLSEGLVDVLMPSRSAGAARTYHASTALFAAAWLFYAVGAGCGAVALGLIGAPLVVPALLLLAVSADLALAERPPIDGDKIASVS